MAKRSSDATSSEEQENGYLHGISPLKISRNNNKYFNGKLQTKHRTFNFVCYAPEKHAEYQVAEKVDSPVKITNIKYSPSLIDSTDLDIQINRRSRFNVMKKLDFKKKKEVEKANGDAVRSFTKISDIDITTSHVMYNIKGRVLGYIEEQKEVEVYGLKKLKREAIVADDTGRIIVTFWENQITQITENKSYILFYLSSRNNTSLKLTTTQKTEINEIEDLTDISETLIVPNTSNISGKILQVQCTGRKKCPSCDKNVEVQDGAEKIKCPSCNLKSHVKSLKESIFTRINIHDHQNAIHRLICFREPLEIFLATREKSYLLENLDELEDFLLDLKHYVKVTCSKDSDIITTIVTADGQL
ncbi:Hypothetical predicted protein [Mytilus galloprovincialis]|uniref:Uncharacterized protein n=1 Tax=Mytilus galloprovincialis TaxID=29158 RepID=A0A8B6BWV6_MYTGA|nr:Hypothetical predicted protein [Mytilus galloprovincialis]